LAGGLAAGLLAGVFGVGGGLLFVPVLVLALGLSQHQAHATSLVAVAVTAAAAAARFALDGAVLWTGVLLLAVGAIVGAQLGARLLPRISEPRLLAIFAVTLAILSVRFIVGASTEAQTAASGDTTVTIGLAVALAHIAGGFAAGIVSSVLGVGGGLLFVPLLALVFDYPQHLAEGSSLTVITPTAIAGALRHAVSGYTEWATGGWLAVGGAVGGLAGAQIALSVSPETLARAFGSFQAALALLFTWRAIQKGRTVRAET
jgi:uncharacterized membrane protein YfcA